MGSTVACNLITQVVWCVNSPTTVGKQTAVQRQANVSELIFGPLEGILWKKSLCVTWRRQGEKGRKTWF